MMVVEDCPYGRKTTLERSEKAQEYKQEYYQRQKQMEKEEERICCK